MHLNRLAWAVMLRSATLTVGCTARGVLREQSVARRRLGHAVAVVRAVGAKLGDSLRLEAQTQIA